MSGLKWVKVVLSGARDKYGEIISKNFNSNKNKTHNKQNKSNQNQINLTKIDEKEIERNKFGFPTFK
jgi:hypothetical protein